MRREFEHNKTDLVFNKLFTRKSSLYMNLLVNAAKKMKLFIKLNIFFIF